ncbi:MAG: PAS domain-containing protein [Methylocystis sp.]|uniref:PAS domain-containing protein n=1 Tax=Methylocystis sp. TaxID=1911079 RepID=UPI003DA4F776
MRLIGTTQEVIEKRRAEDKLLYSEALFRAVFETTSAALAQIDTRTGRFIQVNRRFASLLRHQPSDLHNTRVRDFIVDDCTHDWDGVGGLADGARGVFEADNLYLRQDGSVFRGHAVANRADGLAGASVAVLLLSDLKDGV